MEYKDALEYLKILRNLVDITEHDSGAELQRQTYDIAIEAVEKQIPKKPIPKDGTEVIHLNKGDEPHEWREIKRQDWVCSVCGCFVGQRYNAFQIKPHDQRKCNYCNECGQALDWTGMEEEE